MACPTVWPKLRIARRPPSRSSAATTSALISTERSEEHTSELQSRSDLVCRLLLEKKKKTIPTRQLAIGRPTPPQPLNADQYLLRRTCVSQRSPTVREVPRISKARVCPANSRPLL